MKPTNEQINQAVAELCGRCPHKNQRYYDVQGDTGFECLDCGKDLYGSNRTPLYTTDRNALPEVWEIFARSGTRLIFHSEFAPYIDFDNVACGFWQVMTASPRLHCIVALKACNKWPSDWEEGEDQP